MKSNKEILKVFINAQKCRARVGSGDDEFYAQQIQNYIFAQKKLWLEFVDFVKKELGSDGK